jgi:hypothetical protein
VTEPVRVPRPVESLIRAIAGGSDPAERDRRATTFARGLALGALVGAAIAGSTIWQRRQSPRSQPPPLPTGPAQQAGHDVRQDASAPTDDRSSDTSA